MENLDTNDVLLKSKEGSNKKMPFQLKENCSNILTIHHTIKENDKMLRIIICVACFGSQSQLVAVDKRGTIFIFDFSLKRYWRHMESLAKPSVIITSSHKHNQYIIGNKEGRLVLLDIDAPNFLHSHKISEEPIHEISFPGQPLEPKQLALIRTGHSALIMDFGTFSCTHRLDFDKLQMSLKFASFLPQSEHILTYFNNDSIHIWSSISLDVIRVIYPLRLRDKKIRLQQAAGAEAIPEFVLDLHQNEAMLTDTTNRNLCDGLIASYAYQTDGSSFVLSTWDNYLLFFSPYTFELCSMIHCKDFVLVQLMMMSKPNEEFLVGLTNQGLVILLDCNNVEFKLIIDMGPARNLKMSLDCKYLAVGRVTGELSVWSLCNLIAMLKSQRKCISLLRSAFKQNKPVKVSKEIDSKFQEEVKKLLTPPRLQQILQEFHCYPAKYRSLIWCSLLEIPNNKVQFQDLVQMGTPNIVTQRTRNIQLKNETLKRALIKTFSCLSQWCKMLAYNEAMPELIFPFVKMFQQNSLVTFEICVTLITNQFQLFFEYHPLEPSNYLGLCENILKHYDSLLYDFFKTKDVTSTIYSWNLLKNSFSEVLDEDQWMCLWDNILSAPTYYLVFVVVAYNILQKEVLLRLPDKFIIERFYHEQNPIDIRKLIAKANTLLEKCPAILHPKRYMENFQPVPAKVYPKFLKYPNTSLSKYEEKVQDLQAVHSVIDSRMRDLELEELQVLKRLESGLRQEEHTKRLKEVEKYYQDSLRREEERINCQRKMLLLYQKEIRQRKGQVAAVLQDAEKRKSLLQREHELNSLQYYMEQERMRNDINLMWAEEELNNQELELLAQKSMEQNVSPPSLSTKYYEDIERLCREQKLLNEDLRKISTPSPKTNPKAKVKTKTKSSQNHLDNLERELEKCQMEFFSLTRSKK